MIWYLHSAGPADDECGGTTSPANDRSEFSCVPNRARRGILVTGTLTALIGLFWFAAWMAGVVPQWSATGMITPKTNMALAQLMGGVALLLLGLRRAGGARRWVGAILAALVMLLGALTLSEHLFGWNLGIDQLLATEPPGPVGVASNNRMGPPGSLCHMLLGIGLLALALRRRAMVPYLGLAVCVINLVPAVGFLYGIGPFYDAPHLTFIAWPTVIALMSLGIGLVLSSGDLRPVALFFSNDPGGRLLRRLLPTVLLITVTLGFFAVQIERRGIYAVETATGLLTILLILVFSVMLKQSARRLSRSFAAQSESEARLRLAQSAARIGTFEWNVKTNVNTWTPELEAMHGLLPGGFSGTQKDWEDLVHPEDRAEAVRLVEHSFETGRPTEGEWRVVWPDGSLHWLSARWQVFKDESGEPLRMTGVNIDITERKRSENTVQASVRMLTAANTAARSVDETIQIVLDEIETLTGSTISFYHFLDADQETLTLQAWSNNTLRTMCTAEGKGSHYPVSQAGVWVDCLRERRPVIHNDYASLSNRKGLPPGHAPIIRELVVPVVRCDRIVAIIGVGNKPTDYDERDVEAVCCLGDLSWVVVERKRAEEALHEAEKSKLEFYRLTIAAATDGRLVITERSEIERIAGTSVASWDIHGPEDTKTVRHGVEVTARSAGVDEQRLGQLAVAVGEATTNAIKHARSGCASLHCPDSCLILVVSDNGPGIPALTLPEVALKRGYSTAGTLGMGYKLMIQFADRIYLATDEEGTTVALEMKLGKTANAHGGRL